MYEHLLCLRVTADTDAALPAQTKIHKVTLINGTTSAAASAKFYDAATVTGNPVVEVNSKEITATLWAVQTDSDFPRGQAFKTGVSIDMTGTNAVAYVFYSL